MLDNNQQVINNQVVTFNSTSGTIVKSTPKSRMIRFHMKSPMADTVFHTHEPYITQKNGYSIEKKIPIIVLQVMLCGGEEFLVEFIEVEEDEDTKGTL